MGYGIGSQTLASSLERLDEAAQQAAISGNFAIDSSVENGISANLCEAVTGLWGDSDGRRSLEFAFTWSPARPLEAATPSQVRFTADRIPVIREAGRLMRDREPVTDFELEGAVVKLDRAVGMPAGRITVLGQVEGSPKRVTLELGDPHYHLAVQAHDEEKALRCVGSLVREGRGYFLRQPREVAIEEE